MHRIEFLRGALGGLLLAAIPAAWAQDDPPVEPSGAGAPLPEGFVRRSWRVGSVSREAIVRLPAKVDGAPLILAFHGHGGRVERTARTWKVNDAWSEAVVVFPQGVPTSTRNDPEGRRPGWKVVGLANADLDFVDALLRTAREEWKVDSDRIFAMGHSNGGGFVNLLYGRRAGVFAGLGVVAASGERLVAAGKPCPLIHIGGRADRIVPFAEQERAVEAVRRINGSVAPVEFVIHEGGHAWPRTATAKIVEFFKHQRRAGAPKEK
ncbi:MAG: alpha/beta hydrolase family esterase [Armatimonadota bacterium]